MEVIHGINPDKSNHTFCGRNYYENIDMFFTFLNNNITCVHCVQKLLGSGVSRA
jgi:hypothetical protein